MLFRKVDQLISGPEPGCHPSAESQCRTFNIAGDDLQESFPPQTIDHVRKGTMTYGCAGRGIISKCSYLEAPGSHRTVQKAPFFLPCRLNQHGNRHFHGVDKFIRKLFPPSHVWLTGFNKDSYKSFCFNRNRFQ